jgi:hypothetical protein
MTGSSHHSIIDGVMIINRYNNNDTFQIGYLDASDVLTLKHLIAYAINLAYYESIEKRYEKLQMFSPQIPFLQSVMADLGINQYGQSLLYRMEC